MADVLLPPVVFFFFLQDTILGRKHTDQVSLSCDIYLETEQIRMFNPLLLVFLGQNLPLVGGNVELAGVGVADCITSTL